jgi:hypothetical protein
MSILLLTGISTAMRPVSIPCVFLSEYFLFRLNPVIKGGLMDEVFVVFVGSYGDLFLESGDTQGMGEPDSFRRADLWCGVYDLVGSFDFMGFLPSSPPRIRLVAGDLDPGHIGPSSNQIVERQSEPPYRLARSEVA